jgi:DNA helicase-2/ATP-dependent DNA helicase PcrA
MMKDFINDLNPQQRQAVDLVNSPSVILAGAGSGKTRVLINKVLNLIENYKVDPYSILMITFTNKAAEEMKKRIACRLGFVGTFHAFCAKVLRLEGEAIGLNKNFLIYDENDQLDLLKEILKKRN